MAAGGVVDVPETVPVTDTESGTAPLETQPQTEPETQQQTSEPPPETQIPAESETMLDYDQQLTDIRTDLDELTTMLVDKLDLIDGKLIDPVLVDEQLCYPFFEILPAETEPVPETVVDAPIAETLPPVDYTEDIQALLTAVEDVNTHLVQVETHQANLQNIQIPALCGLALIFGGILALICSNYIKH